MLQRFFPQTLLIGSILSGSSFASECKPLPSEPGWPSQQEWKALNASVSGRLAAAGIPGAVCHPDQDVFDPILCDRVQSQWGNSSWHASNPWTVDFNDDTCVPDAAQPCSDDGYPAYAIGAESVEDVQEAIKFANRTGVRLVVKGTGHDFLGRSSGPGSLSLWTHLLRGIDVYRDDPQAAKYGGVAAVRLAAGMRWGEVYSELAMQNLTVVGGSDPNVGIGGLLAGGGHSAVSAYYGFPADQILELEVVTADGEYRVIDEDSDADLFWAMRGGGPSFGVILSVTVKAFPQLPGVQYSLQLNTTEDSDTYWSLCAYFHTQLLHISEAGGMGYYFMYHNVSAIPGEGSPPGLGEHGGHFLAILLFPNRTTAEVTETMNPIVEEIQTADWAVDRIDGGGIPQEFPSYMTLWSETEAQSVGGASRLGSWLVDEDGLTQDLDTVKTQLRKASNPFTPLLGHLVSGPAVRDVQIPGGGNAVLPAWRNAYSHIVATAGWPQNDAAVKSLAAEKLRKNDVPALKALSPGTGSYINEADPTNPTWQEDYFGENYPKLLEAKRKWDPQGIFWCKPCVGHDDGWEVRDGPIEEDPVEWGVGQVGGRLCRKGD